MKTVAKQATAALLAIVVSFASASPPARDALVGTWHCPQGDQDVVMSFSADGSYVGVMKAKETVIWSFSGKWVLAGNWLHYQYTHSSNDKVPIGARDRDQILELTDERFRIRTLRNQERTYTRVGK